MIFIVVKFTTQPQFTDGFLALTKAFTDATRAEPGNLWFEWSNSLDEPDTYVLVEAFRDEAAGKAHVISEHFQQALIDIRPVLARTPRIVSESIGVKDWSEMGELRID